MISKRTLLNALQKAQVDTIELLMREMAHHALCWRSIHTIPHYSELLVQVLKPVSAGMDQAEKSRLAEGVQWLQINLESATTEITLEYNSVTRRTVIVLADIVENLVESTIGICLLHLDPTQTSIREVTAFKRQAATERLLKQAVRAWESRLFANLPIRTQRIEHMVKAFFPTFAVPRDFELLDQLFSARNTFTHELIRLTEEDSGTAEEGWSLARVDDAFRVASDFLIALMTAIPGDLQAPIFVAKTD
jgi:hypothetical protein